ncbi:MAG TPA: hypothetical protein VME46_10815 [Acidimicrobiales bacterium]|nr:hypothetical protein [Acidimicrobiales bacterium]
MTDQGPINVDGDGMWNDEMLRSLGLIVLRFAALEFCAERLLYGFISDSPLGILVVAGQDISWKLDRLRQVHAELTPTTKGTEDLRHWIDGTEQLSQRRNELVHSVWTVGSDGSAIGFRPKRRGRWNVRGLLVSASMLTDLAEAVRTGSALAVQLSVELAGHPQWKGRSLDEAESYTASVADHPTPGNDDAEVAVTSRLLRLRDGIRNGDIAVDEKGVISITSSGMVFGFLKEDALTALNKLLEESD